MRRLLNERDKAQVEIDGVSVHVTGGQGERVEIGPGGVHVTDGDVAPGRRQSWRRVNVQVRSTKGFS